MSHLTLVIKLSITGITEIVLKLSSVIFEKMKNNEKDLQLEFNFECILETYGLQDETVKKAQQQLSVNKDNYDKEYTKHKQLKAELKAKKEELLRIKLNIDKNLQKVDNIMNKISAINQEVATLQNEISSLDKQIENQSSESTKKMLDIDEEFKQLNEQFEVEILEKLIKEVDEELLLSLRFENKYKEDFETLNSSQDLLVTYERVTGLNHITEEMYRSGFERNDKLDDLQKIENNITFVQSEYSKQMNLLKNYID